MLILLSYPAKKQNRHVVHPFDVEPVWTAYYYNNLEFLQGQWVSSASESSLFWMQPQLSTAPAEELKEVVKAKGGEKSVMLEQGDLA